ncbi:MAG: TSUP family transporter [Elusimicrobiota bacterium]|nr:TSUP family transporter [Elusimicrobiota bacterium]
MAEPALVPFALLSFVAGSVAAVSGFGIGSLMTPFLAPALGMRLAVSAVSLPHLLATALRCWTMRAHVDRRVLLEFGLASGAGGLAGALLQGRLADPFLTRLLGALLVLAGAFGLTGLNARLRVSGAPGVALGVLSGFFGGLVGNQGGIRSAALLGAAVPKDALVATATAVALIVDGCRMPFYLWSDGARLAAHAPLVAVGCAGALAGTLAGKRLLSGIPERLYTRVLSLLLLALGLHLVR